MPAPFPPPPPGFPPRRAPGDRTLIRLIWLYFWLLIFEGALRKWILPGLSGPLLIVRDPVAILIILQAMRQGIKISRGVMITILGMTFVFAILGMFQVFAGLIPATVFVFGMRTYFLHLPLVFILPKVVGPDDVRSFVRCILVVSIPMVILMVYQFVSPADAWINKGVGAEGAQITAARDHIRAAGTFSFISGTVAFGSLMLACCLGEFFSSRKAGWNLNHLVLAACLMISMTSGSRSLVVSMAIVVLTFVSCLLLKPGSFLGGGRVLAVAAISLFLLSFTDIFQEGLATMTERTTTAAAAEGGSSGFISRITDDLMAPIWTGLSVPVYGMGIGLGTNAGAQLATGSTDYLVAEGEWGRIFGEAGFLGGALMVGFRVWIAFVLLLRGARAAKQGNMLPLLLFGAGGSPMFNGQWGQPTSLGFAVFICGLAWAAAEPVPRWAPVFRPNVGPARRPLVVGAARG